VAAVAAGAAAAVAAGSAAAVAAGFCLLPPPLTNISIAESESLAKTWVKSLTQALKSGL